MKLNRNTRRGHNPELVPFPEDSARLLQRNGIAVRDMPKNVGRNCPCGSGKKFKKCCLDKEANNEICKV